MGWLKTAWTLLKFAPEALTLLRRILDIIEDWQKQAQREKEAKEAKRETKQRAKDFDKALKKARDDKDTAQLEAVFKHGHN